MSNWLAGIFGRSDAGNTSAYADGLPSMFAFTLASDVFVRHDVVTTYKKILMQTLDRTHGLEDDHWKTLSDSCVKTNMTKGLITLLAEAMYDKSDLFIVYKNGVIRLAENAEQAQIRADYKEHAHSDVGTWISFVNYDLTDMLIIYSTLEYFILCGLYKSVNVSKAIQLKMSDMRSSTSLDDSAVVIEQALRIANALAAGKDILLDAKDSVGTTTPDINPVKTAIAFLDAKRCYYLNLPLAFVSGEQAAGIGASGDADARAIDRGLAPYFLSIVQPVVEEIYDVDVDYRPEDTRQITAGLEILKGFELSSDDLLSLQTKRGLVARAFDVDPAKELEQIEAEAKERAKNRPPVPALPATPPQQQQSGNDQEQED